MLNIAQNQVSDCLHDLFRESNYFRLRILHTLILGYCCLMKDDLEAIFKAMRNYNLSKCKVLHLKGNHLTGIIEELLAERGLPFVQELNVEETKLNKEDLQSLSKAVEDGKFPQLFKVSLAGNKCDDIGDGR